MGKATGHTRGRPGLFVYESCVDVSNAINGDALKFWDFRDIHLDFGQIGIHVSSSLVVGCGADRTSV